MNTEKPMGIYSAKAAELYGTVFWFDANGKEHEITARDHPSTYKWDDAKIVGDVVKYSRQGRKGSVPEMREFSWRR